MVGGGTPSGCCIICCNIVTNCQSSILRVYSMTSAIRPWTPGQRLPDLVWCQPLLQFLYLLQLLMLHERVAALVSCFFWLFWMFLQRPLCMEKGQSMTKLHFRDFPAAISCWMREMRERSFYATPRQCILGGEELVPVDGWNGCVTHYNPCPHLRSSARRQESWSFGPWQYHVKLFMSIQILPAYTRQQLMIKYMKCQVKHCSTMFSHIQPIFLLQFLEVFSPPWPL